MEYRSDSTIDSPPRESNDDSKQLEAFPEELAELGTMIEGQAIPDKYEVKLELQLKPVGRKTGEVKRVITHGKCAPEYIQEILERALASNTNRMFLECLCGEAADLDKKLEELQGGHEELGDL